MNFARSLLVLLVIFGIGLVGYQIGVSQVIATQLPAVAAPGVPVAYYGYPYHFGFGFFGFLLPLFFLFLLFGLMRAAFGGHRGWKGGYGAGRTWGGYGRIEEIHRELHADKPSDRTGGPSGTAT